MSFELLVAVTSILYEDEEEATLVVEVPLEVLASLVVEVSLVVVFPVEVLVTSGAVTTI